MLLLERARQLLEDVPRFARSLANKTSSAQAIGMAALDGAARTLQSENFWTPARLQQYLALPKESRINAWASNAIPDEVRPAIEPRIAEARTAAEKIAQGASLFAWLPGAGSVMDWSLSGRPGKILDEKIDAAAGTLTAPLKWALGIIITVIVLVLITMIALAAGRRR